MIQSMTAFASRNGAVGNISWIWEMRGVNARGLDIRLRLPEGIDGVEVALRAALAKQTNRGNITVGLRLTREDTAGSLAVDQMQLDAVLTALDAIQDRAFEMGVTLAQPTAADVLSQRGVLVQSKTIDDNDALIEALLADIGPLVGDFATMRQAEGAALYSIISDQLDQIEGFVHAASAAAEARRPEVRANLSKALRRVFEDVSEIEEDRLAQELALLAIKSDVTEEIDRLIAHVKAARNLLDDPKPTGRKMDFLAQEFNREANTLCSKAQSAPLTAIGLDLKAAIDQMREQIQNVE